MYALRGVVVVCFETTNRATMHTTTTQFELLFRGKPPVDEDKEALKAWVRTLPPSLRIGATPDQPPLTHQEHASTAARVAQCATPFIQKVRLPLPPAFGM